MFAFSHLPMDSLTTRYVCSPGIRVESSAADLGISACCILQSREKLSHVRLHRWSPPELCSCYPRQPGRQSQSVSQPYLSYIGSLPVALRTCVCLFVGGCLIVRIAV